MTKGVDLDWFSNAVLLQFILIYKMVTNEYSCSMKSQYWVVLLIFVCPVCILDRFNLVLNVKANLKSVTKPRLYFEIYSRVQKPT